MDGYINRNQGRTEGQIKTSPPSSRNPGESVSKGQGNAIANREQGNTMSNGNKSYSNKGENKDKLDRTGKTIGNNQLFSNRYLPFYFNIIYINRTQFFLQNFFFYKTPHIN